MKEVKMSTKERRTLVEIGTQLGTLSEEDIAFILCEDNGANAVQSRLIGARHRSCMQDIKRANRKIQRRGFL